VACSWNTIGQTSAPVDRPGLFFHPLRNCTRTIDCVVRRLKACTMRVAQGYIRGAVMVS
jgi:hypothetical protein